jgi:dephospho-CoA kinase
MIIAGLTGGVATGKSTVSRFFQDCGAVLIDADLLARLVVEPGKPAWKDLVRTFGKRILNPDRTLNRPALGQIVFQSAAHLKRLNAIMHPRIAREQTRLAREIAQKDPDAVIIYDAPLLIEANAHRRMQRLIVVATDRKTQLARLQRRNHFSRAQAIRRVNSQMPLKKKIALADHVIDGTMSPTQLRHAVTQIYEDLKRLV